MKTMLTLLWAALSLGSLSAQNGTFEQVFENYLSVKNALVLGDGKSASESAGKLKEALKMTDVSNWSPAAKKAFSQAKEDLLKEAHTISSTQNIEKQRASLGLLSAKLWPVIKEPGSLDRAVYYDYCPMKKAYWLAEEATIKNPFYGKQMLSCGKVEQKIN
ncbi:MAG: DUF3347 domain-containing protein [Imperialibacter sp.]|uniref:DUF3347 domain-containing protein n=1 Tax=Imperialibacter sp. TaxID=2038411 RepID=UPI0032EB14BE